MSRLYVDIKCTIWQRFHIPDDIALDVKAKILAGKINSSDDLYFDGGDIECETLFDTGEELTPEDNGDCATIEAYEKSCVREDNNTTEHLIWSNEPQSILPKECKEI